VIWPCSHPATSWNTRAPAGRIDLAVYRADGAVSRWLPYAEFGAGTRRSLCGADDVAQIATDIVRSAEPIAAIEVRSDAPLDAIASALGLDAAEYRKKIAVDPDSTTVNGLRITSCALAECLDAVVERSGWRDFHDNKGYGAELHGDREGRQVTRHNAHTGNVKRGMGIAASSYICGAGKPIYWNDMPHSGVQIRLDRGGGVTVYCGSTDIGQGSTSVLAYIVAEELGVEPEHIHLETADTTLTPVDLGSYSSRVTFMAGNAAIAAARKLREQLFEVAGERLRVPAERLAAAGGNIYDEDDPGVALPFVKAVQLAEARFGALVAAGSYAPPEDIHGDYKGAGVGPSPAYSYSACVAQVAVDVETGEVNVERLWLAHDVGQSINPLLVAGQVEGGAYMGYGEAVMEQQVFRKGRHKIPSLLDYKLPTTLDTPEIETILIEIPDREGPFGGKEAGQGPLNPVIPAIANAVYDAIGVRIDEVPITPDKVFKALKAETTTTRSGSRPQVMPIEAPSPWPTRLITWQPEAMQQGNGQVQGSRAGASPASALALDTAQALVNGFTRVRIELVDVICIHM